MKNDEPEMQEEMQIEMVDPAQAELDRQRCLDTLNALASKLSGLAREQESKRRTIEDRWVEDYKQFCGQYHNTPTGDGSTIFVNLTRNKTIAGEARISDMLFPTDDQNWGIMPTPMPEMDAAENDPRIFISHEGTAIKPAEIAKAAKKQARDRCEAMEMEINDQLVECNYNAVSRDVIHDAAVIGTGIFKGPSIVGRVQKRWRDLGQGVQGLEVVSDSVPTVERVDPWNFFPDMSARTMAEAEFVFERRYLTKKQAKELAAIPGVILENLAQVLKSKPNEDAGGDYLDDLRGASGLDSINGKNRYKLWMYHGPVSASDLSAAGVEMDDDDADQERSAIIWFVDKTVIKACLNPMETEELPYSVFAWERDDSCIFGFGVPYITRAPQKIINGSFRMMMDNSGLSTGPQIVVDRELVEPADGKWGLGPRKIWHKKKKDAPISNAFAAFNIDSHQAELSNIYTMGRQLMDEESSLPVIAQGEQGGYTQTASGMSLLMNSANIVLRRSVKNFDDDVTRTLIRRFYDWNMQNNPKPEIKGDFRVDARGSSHLLVKETQARNAVALINLALSPALAPLTDVDKAYRTVIKSMQHNPEDWMADEPKAPQPPPQDPLLELKEQALQASTQKDMALARKALSEAESIADRNQIEIVRLQHEMGQGGESGGVTELERLKEMGRERDRQLKKYVEELKVSVEHRSLDQKDAELNFKAQTGMQGI